MKLILHGTDGSPQAGEALDLAVELAKDTGAALAVVSVRVVPVGAKGMAPPIADVERQHGAERLAEEAVATARSAGVDARSYVVTGEPARAIADLAEELGADLIVVGSRGLGSIHGALVGSVSRGLISRARTPVTIVAHRPVREPATA
jgi:nucleotide-binding universal stress UspA family protein